MPVCEPVFDEYPIDDDFGASPEFDKLYTEITGTIVLWIEENGLPSYNEVYISVKLAYHSVG